MDSRSMFCWMCTISFAVGYAYYYALEYGQLVGAYIYGVYMCVVVVRSCASTNRGGYDGKCIFAHDGLIYSPSANSDPYSGGMVDWLAVYRGCIYSNWWGVIVDVGTKQDSIYRKMVNNCVN